MTTDDRLLIVVAGPTAVGKSAEAIRIAIEFQTEIISADSRQFYREIPIGTAMPSSGDLKLVPHHFVGHLSIHENYNVSRFEQEVLTRLGDLFTTHQCCVMAGGSGLYLDAVCKGIDLLPDPDPLLRSQLHEALDREGIEALQERLLQADPAFYSRVDLKNPARLIRALEVTTATGVPYSSLRKSQRKIRPFRIVKIGLNMPREILNERIHQRTDKMIGAGWEEEARSVFQFRHLNALNTVGYKELFDYLDGKRTLAEAITDIKTNTRRYAKRQMTWFRKDPEITWFDPSEPELIRRFLAKHIP